MHIVIAPFRPKQGVTEEVMLETSDDFDEQFVRKQDGILKRIPSRMARVGTPTSSSSKTRRRSNG
jgi:hypothetical protein